MTTSSWGKYPYSLALLLSVAEKSVVSQLQFIFRASHRGTNNQAACPSVHTLQESSADVVFVVLCWHFKPPAGEGCVTTTASYLSWVNLCRLQSNLLHFSLTPIHSGSAWGEWMKSNFNFHCQLYSASVLLPSQRIHTNFWNEQINHICQPLPRTGRFRLP